MSALCQADGFIRDPSRTYLDTAGRGLVPRSAEAACSRYLEARAGLAAPGDGLAAMVAGCRSALAALLRAETAGVAFVGSTSDGIGAIHGLVDWRAGDNVVVLGDALEFPSVTIPAVRLERAGVAVRTVEHRAWTVDPAAVAAHVDARTRLVLVSHVSYRTGHRLDLEATCEAVRARGSPLVAADLSQSLGVVPVAATCLDFAVSTAFKWTLGAHGAALLYWNRARVPEPEPSVAGWHAVVDDASRPYRLRADAGRFEPGNPAYLAIYALAAGLEVVRAAGPDRIAAHALELGARLRHGIAALGLECITPPEPAARAGIVSWLDPACERTAERLGRAGVSVTGSVGRVRASMHVYNDAGDVDRLLAVLGGG